MPPNAATYHAIYYLTIVVCFLICIFAFLPIKKIPSHAFFVLNVFTLKPVYIVVYVLSGQINLGIKIWLV